MASDPGGATTVRRSTHTHSREQTGDVGHTRPTTRSRPTADMPSDPGATTVRRSARTHNREQTSDVGHTRPTTRSRPIADMTSDPGATNIRQSTRTRTFTDKGLHNMIDMKHRRMKQLFGNIETKSNQITNLMTYETSLREVQAVFAHWLSLYDELVNVYDELCTMIRDPNQLKFLKTSFDTNSESLIVFRADLNEWCISIAGKKTATLRTRST